MLTILKKKLHLQKLFLKLLIFLAEEYKEIFQFVSETPNNLANHENHLSITSQDNSKRKKRQAHII